eukprot:2874134-Pleurochrysis_carterae.AAC.2
MSHPLGRPPPPGTTQPEARLHRPTNWITPQPLPGRGRTRLWERGPSSRARKPGSVIPSPTVLHDIRRGADRPWPT